MNVRKVTLADKTTLEMEISTRDMEVTEAQASLVDSRGTKMEDLTSIWVVFWESSMEEGTTGLVWPVFLEPDQLCLKKLPQLQDSKWN